MAENVNDAEDQRARFWSDTYNQFFDPLCLRACRSLTGGNMAEAEDAVSEAFLRAMRYVREPQRIMYPFSYMWTTTRRVFFAKRDKENTARQMSLDDLLSKDAHPAVEPEVERMLDNKDLEETLRAKQGPLSQREKLLLELYLEGYNCAEMAAKLEEDERLTRSDLNALKAKVRYRLTKAKTKTKASGQP